MKFWYQIVDYTLSEISSIPPKVNVSDSSILFQYPCSGESCYPYKIKLRPGPYRFEAWGSPSQSFSRGGYTRGYLDLDQETTFYLFVGAQRNFNAQPIKSSLTHYVRGGGASDIRYEIGNGWDDFNSLKSRIMVAGGGGGSEWAQSIGGDGGGLVGLTGYGTTGQIFNSSSIATGGSQTQGGTFTCSVNDGLLRCGDNGSFGRAGFTLNDMDYGGGGGGGYYGGAGRHYANGGGGGSSFVSGHPGCDAIDLEKSTDFDHMVHTGQPKHQSGYVFKGTEIRAGNESVPDPENEAVQKVGSTKSGFIKITRVPSGRFTTKGSFKKMFKAALYAIWLPFNLI